MSFQVVVDQINKQAENIEPLGATFKIRIDDSVVFIDGTGDSNQVSMDDKDADCTVTTSVDAIEKLRSGALNPMMAVTSGKIKIKGDMSLAMKLQSLFG